MKTFVYTLLMTIAALGFVSCNRTETLTPMEEYLTARECRWEGKRAEARNEKKQSRELYDKAAYHYTRVVQNEKSNDTLVLNALNNLRWISTYVTHDYGKSLQYLDQIANRFDVENHPDYPIFLAYKADDLWHFGVVDSAIYYANKALALPRPRYGTADYIANYVLYNIYKEQGIMDSAQVHWKLFLKSSNTKRFDPIPMHKLEGRFQKYVVSFDDPEESGHIKVTIRPKDKKSSWLSEFHFHWPTFIITLILVVLGVAVYSLVGRYRRKRVIREEPQMPPLGYDPSEVAVKEKYTGGFSLPETLILRRSLEDGRRTFEKTDSYADLNMMKMKEKELFEMAYEATRDVESALLSSFNDACSVLHEGLELNAQELVCCFCTHLGYGNNVIAYIGHTTPSAIRKRKERLRKKLPVDLYEVIFGENG
ncbi:MAG: hypothetical protein IKL03_08620 [Bacteroidaceae bacterium]|nr:hypothetical protein [Bacteroidaceae bacterium]